MQPMDDSSFTYANVPALPFGLCQGRPSCERSIECG